jgi:hypothetical protein
MRSALAMLAMSAAAIVVLLPNSPAGRPPSEDAGVFFYAARRILDGGVPYRDIWDHKPPGVYAIDAIGLALGGTAGVWALQVLSLVVAALASLRATRIFGGGAAIFGTFAWLVGVPRLFLADGVQTSYVEFYGLPLQLGALALLPLDASSLRPGGRAVVIGALGGAAFLLKPTLGGIWIAAAIVALLAHDRRALGWLATVAASAITVVSLAFVPFALAGAFGDLVDQAFRYNSAYASFASVGDRAFAIALGARLTLPSGLALVAAFAWIASVARLAEAPIVLRVALIALPLEVALSTFGRAYNYYFLPWLPAMGVLAAYAASLVTARMRPRTGTAILVAAAVAMAIVPARLLLRLELETPASDAPYVAARFLDSTIGPRETVLVWGSHSEVLFLADRLSPTRFVYQYAALETKGYASSERVDQLVADLERARPALIVDASADSFVTPPLDRAGMASYVSPEPQYAVLPELARVADFVAANYVRSGTVDGLGWPVWRLRAP